MNQFHISAQLQAILMAPDSNFIRHYPGRYAPNPGLTPSTHHNSFRHLKGDMK